MKSQSFGDRVGEGVGWGQMGVGRVKAEETEGSRAGIPWLCVCVCMREGGREGACEHTEHLVISGAFLYHL